MNLKKAVAPFVRSPYNYDMNEAGDESALACNDKSKTQQHMADECDINKLVARFVVTGEIPQLNMPPMQGDFTRAPTYQEALNLMIEANQAFMQMPATIRNRFENDPGKFVDFCSDEANRDDMRQMGLWSPEAAARFNAAAEADATLLKEAKAAKEAEKAPKGPKGDTQKGVT